jgi:hypothetical protein
MIGLDVARFGWPVVTYVEVKDGPDHCTLDN